MGESRGEYREDKATRWNALRTGRFDIQYEIIVFTVMETPSSIFPELHFDLLSAHRPRGSVS